MYLEEVESWQHGEAVELFNEMGIELGDHAIDFGCGQGRYTLPLALAVGNTGLVHAVDVSESQLLRVQNLAVHEGLRNITPEHATGDNTLTFAADSSIDAILIYDLIHQLGRGRATFVAEAHRVLKTGGILSVLPFHLSEHEKQHLVHEIESTGFELAHIQRNQGLHFEMHEWKNGTRGSLAQVERGTIYNFSHLA